MKIVIYLGLSAALLLALGLGVDGRGADCVVVGFVALLALAALLKSLIDADAADLGPPR